MPFPSERTPLLNDHDRNPLPDNEHIQFCTLVGIPPSNLPPKAHFPISHKSLYGRATHQHSTQQFNYVFTATLSNSLLLAQVVLSAALTALGASSSSHIVITIFGVLNTIIAGVVAWLKSRGQPMRSRMYRDDLERVVDEIENSETMWLGISGKCHGYGEIDVDDKVTVRSEVARLTRLYDRAVRSNTMNNPDMYMASAGGDVAVSLRARPNGSGAQGGLPPVLSAQAMPAAPGVPAAAPAAAPPPAPEDESPATAPSKPADKETDKGKEPAEAAKKGDSKPNPTSEDSPATSSAKPAKSSKEAKDKGAPNPATTAARPAPVLETLGPGSVAAAPDESPATAVDPGSSKEKKEEKEKEKTKDKENTKADTATDGETSTANHDPDEVAGTTAKTE